MFTNVLDNPSATSFAAAVQTYGDERWPSIVPTADRTQGSHWTTNDAAAHYMCRTKLLGVSLCSKDQSLLLQQFGPSI